MFIKYNVKQKVFLSIFCIVASIILYCLTAAVHTFDQTFWRILYIIHVLGCKESSQSFHIYCILHRFICCLAKCIYSFLLYKTVFLVFLDNLIFQHLSGLEMNYPGGQNQNFRHFQKPLGNFATCMEKKFQACLLHKNGLRSSKMATLT